MQIMQLIREQRWQPHGNRFFKHRCVAVVPHARLVHVRGLLQPNTRPPLQANERPAIAVEERHAHLHVARTVLPVLAEQSPPQRDVQVVPVVARVHELPETKRAGLRLREIQLHSFTGRLRVAAWK